MAVPIIDYKSRVASRPNERAVAAAVGTPSGRGRMLGERERTRRARPDAVRDERPPDPAGVVSQPTDWTLLLVTLMLVGIGMVMVYSSSTAIGAAKFGGSGFFMVRQAMRAAVGLGLLWMAAYRLPVDRLRRLSPILLLIGTALLLVPLVGNTTYRGASRWLHLFGVTFQPSELVKFVLILFLADRLARQQDRLASFVHGLLPHLVILVVVLGLIVVEPDLSTTVAIALIAGAIMLAARVRTRHLLVLAFAAGGIVALLIMAESYRMSRLTGFMGLFGTAHSPSYQIQQGFVALGSGGVIGRGLGRSLQKYFFLPEPYTDSIFPIIGEEFGLVGTLTVVALYGVFGWRGVRVARQQATLFRFLLAVGITANVMVYASLNTAVMTGLLPATGLPLPFISYGGSAMVLNLAATGVLAALSRQRRADDTPGPERARRPQTTLHYRSYAT